MELVLSGSIDDLLGYVERFQISQQLENMLQDFKFDSDIEIISSDGLKQLKELEESQLSDFKFYQFTDSVRI